jgi:hypothetical protein
MPSVAFWWLFGAMVCLGQLVGVTVQSELTKGKPERDAVVIGRGIGFLLWSALASWMLLRTFAAIGG